jgi:hypothetical protein
MEVRKCKGCSEEKPLDDFYRTKIKGKEYIRWNCTTCHNAGIKTKYVSKKKEKPKKVKRVDVIKIRREKERLERLSFENEVRLFINEMDARKRGYFDVVDIYRLIHYYTELKGVIYTDLSIEDELMMMWEELKEY